MKTCEICEAPRKLRALGGGCTNGRCKGCHDQYCTPGGSTSPGHGRRWPDGHPRAPKRAFPDSAAKLKNENDGECHDCGDPAPIGLYQCGDCHAQAREEAGLNC